MKLNIAPPIDESDVNLIPHTLKTDGLNVNSLTFIPAQDKLKPNMRAIFTHGYTSHKSSILSWASRLSLVGIPVTIFDLPGHYLGGFNDFQDFATFTNEAPKLFVKAQEFQNQQLNQAPDKLILGGHSLGALISLHAAKLFDIEKYLFLVGFGMNDQDTKHFFATDFFRKTLNIRKQLVSKHLDPDIVFQWIRDQKQLLDNKNEKICLISGEDDVVIGPQGADNLAKKLELHNEVHLIKPKRLPHNQPEMAATHIFNHLKSSLSIG